MLSRIAIIGLALVGLCIGAALADTPSPAPSTPAPSVTIGPDWKRVPPKNGDALRFERTTSSGVESISGNRHVCDCQPSAAATMAADAFKQLSKAQTAITDTTMCGAAATNLLVTGFATPQGTGNNVDVYFFRMGDSMYTLTYAFRSDQPAADAVAMLPALCPHSPK